MTKERTRVLWLAIFAWAWLAFVVSGDLEAAEDFAAPKSLLRSQALASLTGAEPAPPSCLTHRLQTIRHSPTTTPAERKVLAQLEAEFPSPGERRVAGRDGTIVRCSAEPWRSNGLAPGREDEREARAIEAALAGVAAARRLLVDQLGLPAPPPLEVVLAPLAPGIEGYLLPRPRRDGRMVAVLGVPSIEDPTDLARAAAHQYAHAVAASSGPSVASAFGEALAVWTGLRLLGGPDAATAAALSDRLRRLDEGLLESDAGLAAGNALLLAFLDEAYGPSLIGLVLQEIASGADVPEALDRATRRGIGAPFSVAFREFHLWSHFVGARSDGKHFSFAERLDAPPVFPSADGLPFLSILEGQPVAGLGATSILLRPERTDGGMVVRFEGDPSGRFEADLLLFDSARRAHRLPIVLDGEGAGEVTVPLDSVAEAALLLRNLETENGSPRRYSCSAFWEPGFPFESTQAEALRLDEGGVLVSWDTASERSLVGFNILRRDEGSAEWSRVNPIRIPPMGDRATPASYRFLDESAPEGVASAYRIEGITLEGLSSVSDPFPAPPPDRR